MIATGRKRYVVDGKNVYRTNMMADIPIGLWPCRIEEKVSLEWENGKQVERFETIVTKQGVEIRRYPGNFWEFLENEKMRKFWEQVEWGVSDDDSDLESTATSKPLEDEDPMEEVDTESIGDNES